MFMQREQSNAQIPYLNAKQFDSFNQQCFAFEKEIPDNMLISTLEYNTCKEFYTSHLLI